MTLSHVNIAEKAIIEAIFGHLRINVVEKTTLKLCVDPERDQNTDPERDHNTTNMK